MELAKQISDEKMREYIGKTYKVLIECKTFDGKFYIGRTYMDIPDTDGVVFIKRPLNESVNLEDNFVDCKITDSRGYDLMGEIEK